MGFELTAPEAAARTSVQLKPLGGQHDLKITASSLLIGGVTSLTFLYYSILDDHVVWTCV